MMQACVNVMLFLLPPARRPYKILSITCNIFLRPFHLFSKNPEHVETGLEKFQELFLEGKRVPFILHFKGGAVRNILLNIHIFAVQWKVMIKALIKGYTRK